MTVRIELTREEAVHVQRIIEKGMEEISTESSSEYGVGVVRQIEEQLRTVPAGPRPVEFYAYETVGFARQDVNIELPHQRTSPQLMAPPTKAERKIVTHAKIKKAGK